MPLPIPLEYATPQARWHNEWDQLLNIVICKGPTVFYKTMEADADAVGAIETGDLYCLGQVVKRDGVKRISATLLDGSPVYVPADAAVFRVRGAALHYKTTLYGDTGNGLTKVGALRTGEEIVLVDQIGTPGHLFWEIRNQNGCLGYISASTKVQSLAAKRNSAIKDMRVGGIICLIGLALTVGTYLIAASSPSGGTYIIAWGPAIFGAIQFFRGLIRLGNHREPPQSLLQRVIHQIIDEKLAARESGQPPPVIVAPPAVPGDTLRWYHLVLSLLLPFVCLPWGIVNLINGKKHTGAAMLVASLVVLVFVLLVIIFDFN